MALRAGNPAEDEMLCARPKCSVGGTLLRLFFCNDAYEYAYESQLSPNPRSYLYATYATILDILSALGPIEFVAGSDG